MSQAKRRKPLSESVKNSLKKKADGTKFFYGELAAVYRKGQGAYLSSGSRNVPMAAWAMGRVNSYMRGDKARTADAAIYSRYNKKRMKLTTRQKNTLAKHQKAHGHTKAHMEYMKRKMREGVSFTEAHNMAMKRKGK